MNSSPNFNPVPVSLEGKHVRLEPLDISHAAELFEAGNDEAIWRYKLVAQPTSLSDVITWIEHVQESMANGGEIAFAIIHKADKRAIGSTRYLDIQRAHKTIEIGWTWIGTNYQRSAVNCECKLLLLSHAFENLGAVRVQLRTDMRNEKSKRAIERIGGIKEGVHRKSHTTHTGFVRDSIYYSIIDDEWPSVKKRLEGFLER